MGRVVGSFGVRGWVKVAPLSADPAALLDHPTWWLKAPGADAWQETKVTEARAHGATLVAELEGGVSREEAAARKGSEIGLPRALLPAPSADEMYVSDLVGLDVVNRQGVTLGRVVAVQDYGAHPVLQVVAGTERRLIPFVAAYVDHVDLPARRIDVDWQADY